MSIHEWVKVPSHTTNESWGTDIYNKDEGVIRLVQQNVRGIKYTEDGLNFGEIFTDIDNMQADVTLLVETNLEWKERGVLQTAQAAANAVFGNARIVTSSSETDWEGYWKPGGTLTCITHDTIGRILEEGEDPMGLGRWSRIQLIGQGGKFLSIYGAYRVPNNNKPGSSTAQFQQQLLLMAMKEMRGSTDPRKRFIDDMIETVNNDRAAENEVIIGIDANSVVSKD